MSKISTTTFTSPVHHPTDTDVRIRPYQPPDLEQVRAIFVDGMRSNSAHENYIADSLAADLSDIEGTYGSEVGAFFVMERTRKPASGNEVHNSQKPFIIAMGGLEEQPKGKIEGEEENDLPWCELRRMSVHSSERRKGRGQLLLRHLVEHARNHNVRGIKLSTGLWMESSSICFYKAAGFTDCGRKRYPIPNSNEEVILAHFEMML